MNYIPLIREWGSCTARKFQFVEAIVACRRGESASDQESRGKNRQLAISALGELQQKRKEKKRSRTDYTCGF